ERLVTTVYHQIRGQAKAMLSASSIPAAIKYKNFISKYYAEITKQPKYERFAEAPVYIVYSDSQEHQSCSGLNGGLSEERVLQNFKIAKNGIIIVVDKLQTGFDEPKLHTLFLDKEIRGINAIQTISRVNRTAGKYKKDCKIIDLSYKNVNVNNIKEAFEHFSNVVVSDFDPLGQEQVLQEIYENLKQEAIFKAHFKLFKAYQMGDKKDISAILNFESAVTELVRKQPEDAKKLKQSINKYFRILNLIAFVIEIDDKYSEEHFTEFWYRFS